MPNGFASRLLAAGVTTAIVDGLFACALAKINGSTITRLWQNVAYTILGPSTFEGGLRTALIGVALHIGVAFAWSALFLILVTYSRALRNAIESRTGAFAVAAVYGPLVWAVMSLVVIPLLVKRPPTITVRWWIQLIGHVFFVGLPIVAMVRRRPGGSVRAAVAA